MGRPRRPVAGKRLTRAEWVKRAVELAIKGWSTRRIAEDVGKHHGTVAEALAKEFERVRPSTEEVETLRNIQREQIQQQLLSWIPRSLRGSKDAGLVVWRFLERAAKLDGLDAPTKQEVTGKDGAPLAGAPSPAEAARLIREAFGEHAAKRDDVDGAGSAPDGSDAGDVSANAPSE